MPGVWIVAKVSVLIPARKEPYLLQTIDDLFANAAGEIEVITVLDGPLPDYEIPKRPWFVLRRQSWFWVKQ